MKWAMVAERVLLVLGLVLLSIYGFGRIHGSVMSRVALWQFAPLLPGAAIESKDADRRIWPTSKIDFSLWSEQRIGTYQEYLTEQFSSPLAALRIPKINLEVPVLEGTDGLTLNRAVGRIVGTARIGERGNIGIAGHRDGFFRGLKDVVVGDVVDLLTPAGKETYLVDRILIVNPEDVYVLKDRSAPSITLVTCYPFYFVGSTPQRYIVQGVIDKKGPMRARDVIAIN